MRDGSPPTVIKGRKRKRNRFILFLALSNLITLSPTLSLAGIKIKTKKEKERGKKNSLKNWVFLKKSTVYRFPPSFTPIGETLLPPPSTRNLTTPTQKTITSAEHSTQPFHHKSHVDPSSNNFQPSSWAATTHQIDATSPLLPHRHKITSMNQRLASSIPPLNNHRWPPCNPTTSLFHRRTLHVPLITEIPPSHSPHATQPQTTGETLLSSSSTTANNKHNRAPPLRQHRHHPRISLHSPFPTDKCDRFPFPFLFSMFYVF